MSERTRTTFKVTVAAWRLDKWVVDFSTLRKGDKFILQDDDPLLGMEKGNVCNVATSDAYLRDGFWTIDCEEIEGPVRRIKRIKRGSHPDDWAKPFTIKSSSKVTKEDLLNDDPVPFFGRPSEVAEEITEIEDERVLATALGASKDFLEGPTTYSTIFPFTTRPSDVAEEITEIEDERVLATALGASKDLLDGPTTRFQVWEDEGAYSVPVKFAEEVAAATVQTAAAVLSAAGGEE